MTGQGRKHQPTAIKLLAGTHRKDRDGIPDLEPGKAVSGLPVAPDGMGPHGERTWREVGGVIAANGYFADLDVHAFERFCRLHDELAECDEILEEDGAYRTNPLTGAIVQHPVVNRRFKIYDFMRRYEIDFWLNPTARAGKQVADKGKTSQVASRQRHA